MERSIKILIAQHNFPEEIVEEILSRLPVESLLKFRCVSKSWRSLIDSERFIKTHLKNSTENELLSHHRIIFNPVLSLNRILKMCSWASLLNQPIDKPIEFDDGKYIVNIVGCCNGLVCLVQDTGRFILWNPATRMMHFPDADSNLVGEDKFFMYGFGYVESNDDYKVFVIMTPNESPPIGKVYSLKNHLWKTLEEEDFPCGGDKVGVFVSGNLHWFEDYEDLTDDEDPAIFAFDLKNETFVIVEQPYYSDTIVPTQTLGVIEGCLSVLCDYEDYSQVWVMKEYGVKDSWVNLFTISNFDHPPLMLQRVRSFWTGPNGEVLLTYYSTLMIYHCNIEDNMFHCSVIIDIDKVMGEGVYVESLVSLGPDAVQERQPQSRTLEDQNDIFE